ncbi:hypothetical protein DBR32_15125 [Taibaiella sp. KBW10]|uniref:DUF6580 family putative transport protein n=1 Tax=Taibaiella sp. KBW10 TaxID=2153357 RepID=UPI000F5974CB|nr:DUF6580 family putative transport protein [Taibaiella sp. KBW10]RQO29905.1 hypothetical protein DBR32_15125 [Taibaiella sp. KBW10]
MNTNQKTIFLATLLVLFAVISRIMSIEQHIWNFASIGAISLFSGAIFKNKSFSFALPLIAYLITDIYLQVTRGTGFYDASQFFVYGAMALIVWIGTKMKRATWYNVIGFAVLSSATFFIVSNFGVWFAGFFPSKYVMYPTTLTGLIDCFVAGIPFYKNTFASDIVFSGVLFGLYAFYAKFTKQTSLLASV